MQTKLFQCTYCGTPLDPRNIVDGVIECPSCCNALTVEKPTCSPEAKQFLAIGAHELDICRFDDAFEAYKKAAELAPDEPEAYFGMALATARVQYLHDIVNGRMQPIKHDRKLTRLDEDSNFKQACSLATAAQKQLYTQRAKDINAISKEFYVLSERGIDYDVFICTKVTELNSTDKTQDYVRAYKLYNHLKKRGFKPFFSEEEISGKTGSDYEAYILYALHCSRCMIIVCDNNEYLKTPWVKNEYTRYCELIADEQKERDSITFMYATAPLDRLPGRNGKLQGISFNSPDAFIRAEDFVRNHTSPHVKKSAEQEMAEQMEKMRAEYEAKLAEAQSSAARVAEQAAAKAAEEAAKRAAEQAAKQATEQAAKTAEKAAAKTTTTDMSGFTAGMSDAEFFERMEAYNKEKQRRAEEEKRKAEEERRKKEDEERKRREEKRRLAEEQKCKIEEERRKKEEEERKRREEERRLAEEQKRKIEEERREQERKRREREEQVRIIRRDFNIQFNTLIEYNGTGGNVVIPEDNGIECIGEYAFRGCTGLTSITIPNSVMSIGNYAFGGCTGLTSVTIGNSVTSIGSNAFNGCKSLKSITIPNSVTNIGNYAFYGCTRLTSVMIGNSVTSISKCAFEGCTGLTSITIPNSVTSIGEDTFSGCTGLTSITIPNSVTSIDGSAFYRCTRLTSITIPNSVTSIGSNAFEGCYRLIEVNNKSNIQITKDSIVNGYIGYYAQNVYTPDSGESKLHTVDDYIFYIDGDTRYLMGYTGSEKQLTLPDNYNGQTYEIYKYAFYKCTGITSVTIPNSVTSIGDSAFRECTGLTSITIPNSVTSIDWSAFSGCTGLTSITIPNSVTSIGDYAFYECTGLTSITIPNSVTSIGECAFYNCTGLTSITIPNSVTSIGDYAFWNCTGLTSITIPNSVTFIGSRAFYDCTGLTSVTFEENSQLTSIGSSAFCGCTGLTSITIPNSVTSIDSDAFFKCTGIMKIIIPENVKKMANAFDDCSQDLVIYCRRKKGFLQSRPDGWDKNWHGGHKVVWGYTGD